ncbi:hypothetical protein EPUL_003662, partial [Erysiphe pulchra]
MRRWIGVLCHELYRGLIENYEFTNTDLDNNRQQLGRLIIEEPDKIVKIICAQIVKDLCSKGARAEDLFPRYYDNLVYINFLLAIQEEKTWPISSIFEIQFKEGPGNSNLMNGKEIQLINTRLQLPTLDGKTFQNHLARLLPEIKVEVNTELDRIPDSQEIPISYFNTHCSACEILVRRGSWSDKFFDRNCRNQFMEAKNTPLYFRGELQGNMVEFQDQNFVTQKPCTPHENTKPKAKQPLVSSRRSFGNFQGSKQCLKSKLLGQVLEVENLPDLIRQKETMKLEVGESNPITALPTPSSNVKLKSNNVEKISLPIIIEDNEKNAETGAENIKQVVALEKIVSMPRKTQKRKNPLTKKVKKAVERKLPPTYTIHNTQSKTVKKIPVKKEKFVTESNRISVDSGTSPREIILSDQITKQTVDKTEKSLITHLMQPPMTVSDRDTLQQQDAIALGFVAEQSVNDHDPCVYYNISPKISDQPHVENISLDDKSPFRKETLELQEKLSLLSECDVALIKGLNSMLDEIDNHYESQKKKDLQSTHEISYIQSKDPKYEEKLNLTPQSRIDSLELLISTEKIRKEIFTPKLTSRETSLKISAHKRIHEDDTMRLSETADFSPDNTLNRKDYYELGKSKSIVSDVSKDYAAPKPPSELITTPKSKFMTLDSSKKRTSSYEDKALKKKCKNNFRISPIQNKNNFSRPSKNDRLQRVKPNSEQGENFKEKQLRDLTAIIEKNEGQTELGYDKKMNLLTFNSSDFNKDKNNNFIPKIHQLKQDILFNEFAQKPNLVSFGPQGARNLGKIQIPNQISAKPKSVKSLPKKPWNKTLVEEIHIDSHCGSIGGSSMRPENNINNPRNNTSPVTVGIYSLNTSPASKNPNISKDTCEFSFKISTSPAFRRESPKPGFQGLKVTDEGSPISKKDIGQIYKRNLNTKTEELRYKKKEKNDNFQDKKISSSLKSKTLLAKRVRAGSLSPRIRNNNLTLYETTDNIDFTDMDSREVISQKAMHDPFRTRDSKSQRQNHFLQLLQGTVTKNSRVVGNTSDQVVLSKSTKPFQPTTLGISEKNSLPDSSSIKIKQRNEKWNMAIRTRYEGLYDSVHEIADDLITRLVREEDRMKLLIDQYSRNGAKIINYLSTYREEEQTLILERLEAAKTDILNKESKALTTLTKIYDNMQNNSRINTLT